MHLDFQTEDLRTFALQCRKIQLKLLRRKSAKLLSKKRISTHCVVQKEILNDDSVVVHYSTYETWDGDLNAWMEGRTNPKKGYFARKNKHNNNRSLTWSLTFRVVIVNWKATLRSLHRAGQDEGVQLACFDCIVPNSKQLRFDIGTFASPGFAKNSNAE